LFWRDACLAEAKLLLENAATSEEVGDAVLGVGEPLGEVGEEGSEEAAGEAGLIGAACGGGGREVFEFEVEVVVLDAFGEVCDNLVGVE
jgi:hypothetical protein